MEKSPQADEKNLGLERLIFFSDAVFAIAITLLVLDIQLPGDPRPQDFPDALLKTVPAIGAYVLSFFVIGSYWIAHHRLYQHVIRFDNRLLWLDLLLLLFVAFIPFPTRVLAAYGTNSPSVLNDQLVTILYAGTIGLTGLFMVLNWWYAASGHRLIEPDLDPVFIRNIYIRYLIFPIVFLVSVLVAFVNVNVATDVWYLAAILGVITSLRPLRQRHSKAQS